VAAAKQDALGTSGPLLLVEEDQATAAFLAEQLAADGFPVLVAHTTDHAAALVAQREPSLIVLGDLGERRDALDLLVRAREGLTPGLEADVPVIVLTRYRDELDTLRCFDAGADDVVGRPFSYPELRARILALLRRSVARRPGRVLSVGALRIDTRAQQASFHDRPLALCRREYELLVHLAADPERVFTKHELLRDVWGFRATGATRTLDSHACRLRRKLGDAGLVVNVWGVGYCLRRQRAPRRAVA
jgi:DNA-binding response OmpR family regulator